MSGVAFKLYFREWANQSTDELMLLVQRGDADAFEELYHRIAPVIRRFLSLRARNETCMDDCVQEVFCRIWLQQARFTLGAASAKTYILHIAINVHREHLCKRRFAKPLTDAIASRCVDSHGVNDGVNSEEISRLREARSRLSAAQQLAIDLVYDEEVSVKEAAARLGCSQQAVRRRLQEAHRRLYHFLRTPGSNRLTERTIKP